jgi:hypothetical protein
MPYDLSVTSASIFRSCMPGPFQFDLGIIDSLIHTYITFKTFSSLIEQHFRNNSALVMCLRSFLYNDVQVAKSFSSI